MIILPRGRRIYRNIQKVIQFLLAGNIAEILTLFIATLFNWDAPILAVQVLLVNLITDTLPALALGVDPAEKNIMKYKPVRSGTLFEHGLIVRVCLHGAFISAATIGAFQTGVHMDGYEVGMTMAFLVLAISQLLHALNQRSNTESIFSTENGHNPHLFYSIAGSALVLAIVLLVPYFRTVFSLTMITAKEWGVVALYSVLPLAAVELTKVFIRLTRKN